MLQHGTGKRGKDKMKWLAPQKKNKRNIQQRHHHDQWIYEESPEMSDLLVINTPQIKIVGVDLDPGGRDRRIWWL